MKNPFAAPQGFPQMPQGFPQQQGFPQIPQQFRQGPQMGIPPQMGGFQQQTLGGFPAGQQFQQPGFQAQQRMGMPQGLQDYIAQMRGWAQSRPDFGGMDPTARRDAVQDWLGQRPEGFLPSFGAY